MRSMTSYVYCPGICSSQMRFRFLNAEHDFGVWPAV
jgi:hypothetical protein